jgi:hypothetical protein
MTPSSTLEIQNIRLSCLQIAAKATNQVSASTLHYADFLVEWVLNPELKIKDYIPNENLKSGGPYSLSSETATSS